MVSRKQAAWSRRTFLKAAASLGAVLPGCLYNALTELPPGPVTWKPFRFIHLGGLGLSYRDDGTSFRWAMAGAERIRSLREIDFLLLGGDLVRDTDPSDLSLLEDFLGGLGLPWYAVPGASDRGRTVSPTPAFLAWARALGAEAWAPAPWEASPLEGVRLVGLDAGPADGVDDGFLDRQIPFLTGVIDKHPEEALIVLLHRPPRVPASLRPLKAPTAASELLRFVLEAAGNVKMVFSGSVPAPFLKNDSGLLTLGTPPIARFPHLLREMTVIRHGVIVRNRHAGPPWARAEEKERLARSVEVKRLFPDRPGHYISLLEGSEPREKVYALR